MVRIGGGIEDFFFSICWFPSLEIGFGGGVVVVDDERVDWIVGSLVRERRKKDDEGCIRRMDGTIRTEKDRSFVPSHAVFRIGASASCLLQEETSG